MAAIQHGSVVVGEQMVFEGDIDVRVSPDGWTASFSMDKITIPPEAQLTLNLSDGRSGQMIWERTGASIGGAVLCQGIGTLR